MKIRNLVVIFTMVLISGFGFRVQAAGITPEQEECIGKNLSNFVSDVKNTVGITTHLRLLSPAFNMNSHGIEIAKWMGDSPFAGLAGIAGNAYNVNGELATETVSTFMSATGLNKPVMITETSDYLRGMGINLLGEQFRLMRNGSTTGGVTYLGASLFNAFGNNTDPLFTYGIYSNAQIQQICGGSCNGLGVNFADFLDVATDSTDGAGRASGLGMTYVVGLVNVGNPAAVATLINSLPAGIIPILRTGTSWDATGPTASEWGAFLRAVDQNANRTFYALSGPNEPQTECWATPMCGYGICGSAGVEEPRTLVGRVTSARITIDEDSIERSNQAVQGATICGYHGNHKYGKGQVGTGIYGFYGSAVTDEKGAFRLESVYRPGGQYSNGSIVDADIIVVYTGDTYQEAQIIPMAQTMERLGLDNYNRNLYGELDLTKTLIPLDDIQTSSDTIVTPANFGNIVGYTAAVDENGNTDAKCPNEAFYVSRDVANRSSCLPGRSDVGSDYAVQEIVNRIGLVFNPDDQYKGTKNNGKDYTPLDEMLEYTVPTAGKTSAGAMPEGRVTSRQAFMALEEMRAAVCKVIGCKEFLNQPTTAVQSENSEIFGCEYIKSYLTGEESLKARGLGLHLASPSYYDEEGTDVNAMATMYYKNQFALESPYCITDEGETIIFGDVEPYSTWKRPDDIKVYTLGSEYFDPRYVYLTEGNQYPFSISPGSDNSYATPEGEFMDTKSFIYTGPLYDPNHIFNPGDPATDSEAIDNAGQVWRTRNWAQIPEHSFSQQGMDAVSAAQYIQGEGAVPPTDYISPPIYVNERDAIQKSVTIANIRTDLANFGYSQIRYRIGVQDLLCTFSDMDGHRLTPTSSGFRGAIRQVENQEAPDKGGWFETYYDYRAKDTKGHEEVGDTLFGYGMSLSGIASFIKNLVRDVWSFFPVFGDNYWQDVGGECSTWVPVDSGNDCNIVSKWLDQNCGCVSVPKDKVVACKEGEEDCSLCPDGTWCKIKHTTVKECTRRDYSDYTCVAKEAVTKDVSANNEVYLRSRNSMVGINYFTNLLSSPSVAETRVEVIRMHGLDTYATSAPEPRQGEGALAEIGQGSEVSELGKLVGDPRF